MMLCRRLPIHAFFAAMIDKIILESPLGPPQPSHYNHLVRIVHRQVLTEISKPITTFINSPLTGAQMSARYSVRGGVAYLELELPLASAAVGHNLLHAGAESIEQEVDVANLLSRIVLNVLGFSPAEISHWLVWAQVMSAEITWHTRTSSLDAARKLRASTTETFEARRGRSARHDVTVKDVDVRRRNEAECLLVTFKTGDQFRQYIKAEQVKGRSSAHRKHNPRLSNICNKADVLEGIAGHVRNELIFKPETLESLGLRDPRCWSQTAVEYAVECLWNACVDTVPAVPADLDHALALMSPEVRTSFERWHDGENPRDFLGKSALTRHRQRILRATGLDIADRFSGANANRFPQLSYSRRFKPGGALLQHTLCKETAAAILQELESGVALLCDGVVPEQSFVPWGPIDWASFANRYPKGPSPVADTILSRRAARRLGEEPLPFDCTADWINVDGVMMQV